MIDTLKLRNAIEKRYPTEPTYSARLIRLQQDTGLYVPNIQRIIRVKNASLPNLILICRALNIKIDDIVIMEE